MARRAACSSVQLRAELGREDKKPREEEPSSKIVSWLASCGSGIQKPRIRIPLSPSGTCSLVSRFWSGNYYSIKAQRKHFSHFLKKAAAPPPPPAPPLDMKQATRSIRRSTRLRQHDRFAPSPSGRSLNSNCCCIAHDPSYNPCSSPRHSLSRCRRNTCGLYTCHKSKVQSSTSLSPFIAIVRLLLLQPTQRLRASRTRWRHHHFARFDEGKPHRKPFTVPTDGKPMQAAWCTCF